MAAVRALKSPEIVTGPLGDEVRESHFELAFGAAGRSSHLQWLLINGQCPVHISPFDGSVEADVIIYRQDSDALRQINYVG